MLTVRRAWERGHANHGWLAASHTFSFANYDDPRWRGFRALRVFNEDRIAPGAGFGMHGHRDMEIITYVLDGALRHTDSMGNTSVLERGGLQRMTAGTGVRHSEMNASATEPIHLVQIWILPERAGLTPSYEETSLRDNPPRGAFRRIAARKAQPDELTIHQDASIWLATLAPGETTNHSLAPERYAWVQVLRGMVTVNGHALQAGDGLAVCAERDLAFDAAAESEIMLFDLA